MTFDEFKEKGTELEMDLDMVTRKTKSLGSSSDIDDHFINLLLFQAQLKIMHWGTESYSEHNAFGSTYGSIDEGLDSLVESYQGKYGIITGYGNIALQEYQSCEAIIMFFETLCMYVEKSREMICQDSYIQNQIDEIVALIKSTIYKLRFLK